MTDQTYPPVWAKHVIDYNAPTDVDAITETVEAVFDEWEAGRHIDFHCILFRSSWPNMQHLAAVLRVTYSRREQCSGWTNAAQWCRTEDPELSDLLYGFTQEDFTE